MEFTESDITILAVLSAKIGRNQSTFPIKFPGIQKIQAMQVEIAQAFRFIPFIKYHLL